MHITTNTGAKHPRRRRMLLRTLATSAAATAIAVAAPVSMATADESYIFVKQGADWGQLYAGGSVTICDKEADGHQAYLKIWSEGWTTYKFHDENGSKAGCSYSDYSFFIPASRIDYFKVCESINNRPDKCSDKAYVRWGD